MDGTNPEFESALARARLPLARGEAAQAVAGDFGRLERGRPLGVISVRDERELCAVFELANERSARLTLRTGGASQSGQSLAHGSYCVSLAELERFVHIDPVSGTATCSASSSWRAVIDAAAAHGLVPRVVPLNVDLSVGGTLSAGGIGASSHRYGSACSSVVSLTAVTGAAERVECSRERRRDVFDAVLGGLGRAAAITRLSLALRPAEREVQSAFLLYDNLASCLEDLRWLSTEPACAYLEGSCSACFQGLKKTARGREPLLRWFYGIQLGVEGGASEASLDALLGKLRCFEVSHRESDDHRSFLDRYQARFRSMRSSGAWEQAHPWFECFLPAGAAAAFIEEVLPLIPPALGDGHRLFVIDGADRPRYLQVPVDASNTALAFAVLPAGVPAPACDAARSFIERATALLERHGGRRYLSGWLAERGESFWRRHHGGAFDAWVAAKRALDPNGVLTSQLFAA